MSAPILLTGAQGQLGWEVARQGPAAGLTVRGFDHAALDIADADAVARAVAEVSPGLVINAAAYTAVDKAESEAARATAVNADGPRHLAAACVEAGIPLIHISTDYVFDGRKKGAYLEDDATAPLGVYGASKLAGEAAVRDSGVRHIILRTAWVYGVHGNNFVKTMLRLGAERDTLRVVDDQHGCPTFAADLAGAVLTLARRMIDGGLPAEGYGTFHCVGAGPTTWFQFAEAIFAAAPGLARRPKVEPIGTADYPTPAKRPANSVLDCAKLARVHGIALRPWREGLADMLRGLRGPA